MMDRILLVDADGKKGFPNLALMKISAWYKMQGYKVDLIKGVPQAPPLVDYFKAYISCIFYQNASAVSTYARMLDCEVTTGGIGISHDTLPDEIEHIMPDYSLYGIDFSMGFTSRGCNRKCPWCVVPSKEGGIRDNAPISEFLRDDHNKVVLMDNNFQASPRWRENLDFIIENELKVNFNQGLDIRKVTKEFAARLSETKYYSWTFKNRGLHFSFDTLKVEKAVRRGLKKLQDAGIPARIVMFYVLVGFDTTIEEDLYRVQVLKDLGVTPFIMIFNRVQDPELRRLARWVNRRFYQFIPWSDLKK